MNLLLATSILLVSAATIGFYMVYLGVYRRKRSPRLGLVHAGLALCGIIILITQIYIDPSSKLSNASALFLFFAIIGGIMVFALHEENEPPSMPAVTAHAIMGLIGLALLVPSIF